MVNACLFPFRCKPFQWTEKHDVLLCREILVCEPFYLKPRSAERGKTWEKIATNLNMLQDPKFRVTARSVRDRCTLLTAKHAQKLRVEEGASGIVVEETELDNLLEDILEKEKLGKEQIELDTEKKKSKANKEKCTATSIREEAMKRMTKQSSKGSETDNLYSGSDEEENYDKPPSKKKKRVRRSVNDAIGYLQAKAEKEYSLKMQEMDLRKKELETTAEREKAKAEHQEKLSQQQQETLITMLKQMQQQQQNQQNLQAMLITQQQQQNQILMALMDKSGEKLS